LRVHLALWAIFAHGRHFLLFYAFDAWAAWLLPLLASIAVLQRAGYWRTISRYGRGAKHI